MKEIKCNRCGKEFPLRSMMAESSGKGLVCQNCFDVISKVRTDADKLIQKKFQTVDQITKGSSKEEKEAAERIKQGKEYVCKSCNYKFITNLVPKRCPYCSEQDRLIIVEELTKEIDDILKEKLS